MNRRTLIETLAASIVSINRPHPIRVGIDGVDGVGKTSLADELVEPIRNLGRTVIRASVDGFHNPRTVRYRRGRSSPDGFFLDSFDYTSLIEVLLAPLGPGGGGNYQRAVFNWRTDSKVITPVEKVSPDAVLLFDGIFLHRLELRAYWDFSLFLDAPFEITFERMAARDGSSPNTDAPENRRYVDGQILYLQTCIPKSHATVVIDNRDLASPELIKCSQGE